MSPNVDTEDLVDSQDVAELLRLSHRSSVTTYLRRYPDFPPPVIERGRGRTRLWTRQSIEDWARDRSAKRQG